MNALAPIMDFLDNDIEQLAAFFQAVDARLEKLEHADGRWTVITEFPDH